MIEALIALISGGALFFFGVTAISNVFFFPRLRRLTPSETPQPFNLDPSAE
jgi:hypothetical protein